MSLRMVPKDRTVVLGLVTTKTPRIETVDGLRARVLLRWAELQPQPDRVEQIKECANQR